MELKVGKVRVAQGEQGRASWRGAWKTRGQMELREEKLEQEGGCWEKMGNGGEKRARN